MTGLLLWAFCLAAATVAIHAAGLGLLFMGLASKSSGAPRSFWITTWLLVRIAWALLLIHALEITLWGWFYLLKDCLPDASTAFYFSGVTYTTLGYGDVLLQPEWRLLGPIQGLVGILMCGLSTGFFLAVVSRIYGWRQSAP